MLDNIAFFRIEGEDNLRSVHRSLSMILPPDSGSRNSFSGFRTLTPNPMDLESKSVLEKRSSFENQYDSNWLTVKGCSFPESKESRLEYAF